MKILFSLFIAALFLGIGSEALAQAPTLQYVPLEPIAGVTSGTSNLDISNLLKTIFRILFSLGALLSVVMLVIAGVEYMVSDVIALKVQGKKRAQNALWGMFILAGSWLILNTINPDLLNLNFSVGPTSYVDPAVQNNSNSGNSSSGSTVSSSPCLGWMNASNSSGATNGNIVVNSGAYKTFASNSTCVQSLQVAGATYQNNKNGYAVLILDTRKLKISDFKDNIQEFTSSCEGVGAKAISSSKNPGYTFYVCIKR